MRNIVNISLPDQLDKEVVRYVKQGGFASKSEFFRHLLRIWKEHNLAHEIELSRKEIALGKGKKLSSLKSIR